MTDIGGIGAQQLRSYIERIERLAEEKAALAADIKEVYAEAKGNGFDTPTMRAIVKLRKMDSADREEQEQLLDLYKHALGMTGTPLHEAGFEVAVSARDGAGDSGGGARETTLTMRDGSKGTLSGPHAPDETVKGGAKRPAKAREPEAAAAS